MPWKLNSIPYKTIAQPNIPSGLQDICVVTFWAKKINFKQMIRLFFTLVLFYQFNISGSLISFM